MSQQLISHSSDLRRLRDEGYEIEVRGGYLITHHIPYINKDKELMYGVLVCPLTLLHNITTKPDNHVIHFAGRYPCNIDGSMITCIQHCSREKDMGGIITNHSFSNKPSAGYTDYYDKVKRYIELISAPAKHLHPDVTEKTFKVYQSDDTDSVFQYIDTNSSRSSIDVLNNKLSNQKVAIIGLGGTGSYILDLISKICVAEIHLFDKDKFKQHNAFRAPGACSVSDIEKNYFKVDYLSAIYSKLHRYIYPHNYHVTEDNLVELDDMSFVFLSADNNKARYMIAMYLRNKGIPFIDVGLGVQEVDGCITGLIRVSTVTNEYNEHLSEVIPKEATENNDYVTNIQIAELNALNATLAVLRWKRLFGFYADLASEHNSVYSLNTNKIINDKIRT